MTYTEYLTCQIKEAVFAYESLDLTLVMEASLHGMNVPVLERKFMEEREGWPN